jgi:hypothetical protein
MKIRKFKSKETYDKNTEKPIIRASICTGEKIAGFKDIKTGQFREILLIRDSKDMDRFLESYEIEITEIKTEW